MLNSRGAVTRWWADRPLTAKGLVVVALPLFVLLGSIVALHLVGRVEARAERDVRITFAIQADVHQVHALLAEAASGVRGYLLTGQPRFLEPYEKAEVMLPTVLTRLRARVRDREASQRLDRIVELVTRKREGLSRLRAMRDARGSAAVNGTEVLAALVANKRVLDALRLEIERMQARERVLLAERQARADTVRQRALAITAAAALLGVVGGLAAMLLFLSGVVRRVQRLQHDAALLERGEPLPPFPGANDEVGRLADRIARAGDLLRAREAALREGEERFRLVIEGVRDYGIFALDPEGFVVSWNVGAERIKGWTAEEIVGQHYSAFYLEDERPERPTRNLAEAVVHGRVEDEGWRVRKDGTRFWANVVITVLRDENGALRGFSKVTRDITERRLAEEALVLARREAEAASQAKSVFLSRMSHELRTPLNAILGFAQLLELDGDNQVPEAREATTHILRAGRHLLSLIDEVLDIARIESGQFEILPEPVDIAEIVSEAIALTRLQATARQVTVGTSHVLAATVTADRRRVLQVLLNLFSNAVKYNFEGGRVDVRAQTRGAFLELSVTDTGIGIEAENVSRLFRPFERLGAAAQAREGTGLGLSLCRGLVEGMGGEIGYRPPDRDPATPPGACFWFTLPLATQARETSVTIADPAACSSSAVERLSVLLIEDNLANARLVETVLARACPDARLLQAMQATIGTTIARDQDPRLILLDFHLPDHDGQWVLERLKADGVDAPVLLLTADAMAAQRDWSAAGVTEVFTKPLDVPRLLVSLRHHLQEDAL